MPAKEDARLVEWRLSTVVEDAATPTDRSRWSIRSEGPDSTTPDPSLAPPMRPRGLARVGRYEVRGELGRGGMGTVFEAYDPVLDRRVALKLLRPLSDGGRDADRVRLLREAQALARLSHRNVVSVFDVLEESGAVFIAMELVEGQSLRHWLERPRGLEEVLAVFVQAGEGLAAAHAKGIVHRDFKPANVLLGANGVIRVCDFGIALSHADAHREVARGAEAPATGPPAILGTPRYMAPEQQAGRPVDARADQFSFCVALYQALYGIVPDVGPAQSPTIPAGSTVPRALGEVVLRGLSWEPERRFSTMQLLLGALHRARSPSGGAGSEATEALAAIRALLLRGDTLTGDSEWEAAAEVAAEAEERARRIDDPASIARALNLRVQAISSLSGDFALAESLVREAMHHAARADDRPLLAVLWLELLRLVGYGQARYAEVEHLEIAADLACVGLPNRLHLKARMRHVVGMAAWRAGDLEAARRRLEEARALLELTRDSGTRAHVLHDLGIVLQYGGAYAEAQAAYEACLEVWLHTLGPEHTTIAHAYANLGNVLTARGRLVQAQAMQEHALGLRLRLTEPDSLDLAVSLLNLGEVLMRRNLLAEAIPMLSEARSSLAAKVGDDHEYPAYADLFLARIALLQGDPERALSLATPAVAALRSRSSAPLVWRHWGVALLAEATAEAGDPAEARARLAEAEDELASDEARGIEHVNALEHLTRACLRCDGAHRASSLARRAVRVAEETSGPDTVYVGCLLALLAELCHETGDHASARDAAERAVALLDAHRDLGTWPERDEAQRIRDALAAPGS